MRDKVLIIDAAEFNREMLTDEEFECMKSHTVRGCEVIDHIEGVWDDRSIFWDTFFLCKKCKIDIDIYHTRV